MSLLALLIGQFFGLPEAAVWVVKVIAAIGGAFVGWFASDPVARITYRLVAQKAIPGAGLLCVKLASAATLATLLFILVSIGGGLGGLGFGPGLGGSPGKGAGAGGTGEVAQGEKTPVTDEKAKPADKPPAPVLHKKIEIEVLGGVRDEKRYYLLKSTGKAMNLSELEAYFKANADRLELHVLLTDDSPDTGLGIIEDLVESARRHGIPSLVHGPNEKR